MGLTYSSMRGWVERECVCVCVWRLNEFVENTHACSVVASGALMGTGSSLAGLGKAKPVAARSRMDWRVENFMVAGLMFWALELI